MALNLAKHLHETQQPPLKVWNRSQDRVEAFQKLAENTPTEVVQSLKEIGESTSCHSIAVEEIAVEEAWLVGWMSGWQLWADVDLSSPVSLL